jgi:glucokinase
MYLACDLGGTNGRVKAYGALDSTEPMGGRTFKMTSTTPTMRGDYGKDFGELRFACQRLQTEFGPIEGIGLALAGKRTRERSTLLCAGNLDHWSGQTFVPDLIQYFGCKVVLGGDAEALALAEAVYGVGQRREYKGVDFVGMIWGTGIGGAAVRYTPDGRYFTIPMEPGHQRLYDSDVVCGCGQTGCLEAYCGGNGIRRRFGRPAEALRKSEWLDTVIPDMVAGVRGVLTVQPVDLVVFSGSMAVKDAWLLDAIQEGLGHPMLGDPKLEVSAFGGSAGTLGALSLLSL